MIFFVFLPLMNSLTTHIYTTGDPLPQGLRSENFFHSPALFELATQTPRHRPYMVTVETDDGCIEAQLLALVRYRSSLFPPYFFMHCRVLGEGSYAPDAPREELLALMLEALRSKLDKRVLYFEVSHLSQKMFGYREFRSQQFFPVRWMSVHNSLHSKEPSLRLQEKTREHIAQAYQRGVETIELSTERDFKAFSKLLHHHNWLKPKRFVPHDRFFRGILQNENGRLFVTKYKNHVIGCSVVVYSERQAYLWYSAYRRKSFVWLHPAYVTIWHAIQDSYQRGYEHIYFMDVGLPLRRNRFRDFILSFGGKPASTYRWFHCSIGWINRLFSWLYRE